MSWLPKIATLVCIVFLGSAAAVWSLDDAKAGERKLVEAANLTRIRAEHGNAKAQDELGSMYYYGRGVDTDYRQAAKWYRKAAEQGYANAQNDLGLIYYNGQDTPQDYKEAAGWFRKAAEQNNADAQYNLGYMYLEGLGVSQDYHQAFAWIRKAADQNYANAQEELGSMYYYGEGAPQDYVQAAEWFRKAAEQDYAEAQYDLGLMYDKGAGVPQNHAAATLWYQKAADNGDIDAQRALSHTKRSISGSLALLALILGGIWLLIDLVLRHKSLRNWPQRAARLRTWFSWLFALNFLVILSASISGFWATAGQHLLTRRLLLAIFSGAAVVNGMSWWTVFRKRSSARLWGIAASLLVVLFYLIVVIPLGAWDNIAPFAVWMQLSFILAIGIAGLAAFACPFEFPTKIQDNPHIPGDGTGGFSQKIVLLVSIAAGCAVFSWWIRSMEAQDTFQDLGPWSVLLLATLVDFLIVILHEFGHAVTALALGMKLRAFTVGPFQWGVRDGKWQFQFKITGILFGEGATGAVPSTTDFPRWRSVWVTAAGPLVNLLAGAVALWVAFRLKSGSHLQTSGVLFLFAGWSLVIAVANLLPFKTRNSYSDGASIYQQLSRGPWGDFHRVRATVVSSLVTSARPRNYDIQSMLRAADGITQGPRAIILRLWAYTHFLDCGCIAEASKALTETESIYERNITSIPAEFLTVFVFGDAYVRRDAAAARKMWTQMEARKPIRFNVDYWIAKSALHWIEGNLKEANEALDKANKLAQQLPQAGAYEFDRYRCSLLRQAMDQPPAAG